MLKKSHRLSTKEFLEVMEKGKIYHSPLFIMRALRTQGVGNKDKGERSKEFGQVKISAVTPKKIANTAVLRNKTKRLIYEAVQPLITSIIPDTHMIMFAKNEAIKSEIKTMTADLKGLFSKAKISV
jgi:ribonuclease P protein component